MQCLGMSNQSHILNILTLSEKFFASSQVFSKSTIAKPGDQNIVEMLHKCPFADAGCTADFMSYEDLQQHLELVHVHTIQPHGIMLFPPDQTTLLCSSLQPFTAIMPSDTEASPPLELSEWIHYTCDSEFAEDGFHLYINDEGQDGTTQLQQESFGQSVSGADQSGKSSALTTLTSSRLSGHSHTRSPSTRQEAGIPSSHMS